MRRRGKGSLGDDVVFVSVYEVVLRSSEHDRMMGLGRRGARRRGVRRSLVITTMGLYNHHDNAGGQASEGKGDAATLREYGG